MRLNRVLLLAASTILMVFAMVFTISCSGDDGKDGKNGKSCTVQKKDGGSYDVLCDDEVVGQLSQGPKGDKGDDGRPGLDAPGAVENNCVLGKKDGDSYKIDCGSTTVTISPPGSGVPAGTCVVKKIDNAWHAICDDVDQGVVAGNSGGATGGCSVSSPDKYNEYELQVTCGSNAPFSLCNGVLFDNTEYVCGNSAAHQKINTSAAVYTVTSIASPAGIVIDGVTYGSAINYLPGEIALLAAFRCTGSSDPLEYMKAKAYNPNKEYCEYNGTVNTIKPACAGGSINRKSSSTGGDFCQVQKNGKEKVMPLCKGSEYPNTHFCNPAATSGLDEEAVLPYCGFDSKDRGIMYGNNLAGSVLNTVSLIYTPNVNATFCIDGKKVSRCLDNSYLGDSTTSNKPVFVDSTEFCRKTVTTVTGFRVEKKTKCGPVENSKREYNDISTFCENNLVQGKCGTTFFNDETHFCSGTIVARLCDDRHVPGTITTTYDPRSSFCEMNANGELIKSLCKGFTLNAAASGIQQSTTTSKFNENFWNWEYCKDILTDYATDPSSDLEAADLGTKVPVSGIIYCQPYEEPEEAAGLLTGKCTCIDGAVREDGTPLAIPGTASGKCGCTIARPIYKPLTNTCVATP